MAFTHKEVVRAECIALRGAWHLGDESETRKHYHDHLSMVYSDASRVIHAGEPRYVSADSELLAAVQEICRQGILKMLNEGVPDWDSLLLGH